MNINHGAFDYPAESPRPSLSEVRVYEEEQLRQDSPSLRMPIETHKEWIPIVPLDERCQS
jgi:hypothetical protein